ncbi:MAG: Hpt domain-containing protein [Solirubrobacterales bacterium]
MNGTVPVVDINKFRDEIEVDNDTLKELYKIFIEELNQQKNLMRVQIESMELEELKKTIHNIKGISGNYKALKVWDLSSKVYDELRDGEKNESDLNNSIKKIENSIEDTIDEINRILWRNSNAV